AGPADLLSGARVSREPPADTEALRLLVRSGGRLLASESALEREPSPAACERALLAMETTDLACGAALLVSARRWVPGAEARDAALHALADAERGFQKKMTWTRFHDLVEAHRAVLRARRAPADVPPPGEVRRRLARTADR